jgi:hypothetical protein
LLGSYPTFAEFLPLSPRTTTAEHKLIQAPENADSGEEIAILSQGTNIEMGVAQSLFYHNPEGIGK